MTRIRNENLHQELRDWAAGYSMPALADRVSLDELAHDSLLEDWDADAYEVTDYDLDEFEHVTLVAEIIEDN